MKGRACVLDVVHMKNYKDAANGICQQLPPGTSSPAFLCHSGLWKSIPHTIWTCSTPCSHGVLTLTIPGHHVWVGSSGRPQERLQSEHFPPQPRQTRTEMPRIGQCRTNTKTHCWMFLFWTGAYCLAQADMELTMSSG